MKKNILLQFWAKETHLKKKKLVRDIHEIDISTLAFKKFWELTHYDFQIMWQYISKYAKLFLKSNRG